MGFPKRLGIYILILFIPIFYRWKWNENTVFVSSDPEIKYYQVIQNVDGGKAEECYFPAKEMGFDISMVPFGYPWAFFLKNGNCVFQYPVIFTWIQKIFISISSKKWITYIPILFFFFNFCLLDRILSRFEKRGLVLLFLVIFIQCLTPIFLSSLDYSELTLTNFFFLSAILSFYEFQREKQFRYGILLAVSIAFNFQLRPESTIALIFFLVLTFTFGKEHWKQIKNLTPYIFLCLALQFAFFIWNHNVYGHFLGMRGLNTVTDMESGGIQRHLIQEWVADLWGNDFKIGIFKGYPILILGLIVVWRERRSELFPLVLSGILFVLILPILSPYRAGVDIFGMRYYESGVYLLMTGAFLSLGRKTSLPTFLLILLPFIYFSYKSDSRAIKQWTSSAKLYHQVMKEIDTLQPDLIVHRGLSLSYLVGYSYIQYPQVAVYSNEDWMNVEKVLGGQKKRVLFLQWEGNKLVNEEFPESIWKQKFDINFTLEPRNFKILSEHSLAHFKGFLLEQKR
ncbi:LA_3751/LA_3752 family putative glycosyltransferase [Leptospira terpstrae]|uniref:LA_3751/LA_3752 family putative glycosyltransferase n=1 Tax=Leptospira terpstrae TaxID=293075 RepID=UPI003CFCB9BE